MGTVPSVEVEAEAESPSTPGKRSAVSGPLDEYCDFESFFEGLVPILREPLFPLESYVLKSIDITDDGPESFTVKIIHDAKKLNMYGFGSYAKDGKDFLRLWQKVRYSRAQREIVAEEFTEDGQTQAVCHTLFLKDPLRVEFWCDMPNGERKCDERIANLLKSFYIIPVLKSLMKRKVSVMHCVDSPGGLGKSALSGSLDEYVDYDSCFDMAIEVLQDSIDKQPDGKVVELSENEFEMTMSAPSLKDGSGFDTESVMKQHIRHDRKTGDIINVAAVGGQLLYTSWIKIHRSPLIVEHWTENDGKRIAGRQETSALQMFVDSIVAKSEGEGSWFW
mmetsp:Transcript_53132/g.119769  ORF Transcript_53132/g.119769 Transcript_53132/m.119769 type:complete len:334 (+) Transcript_53132:137-1138(+)